MKFRSRASHHRDFLSFLRVYSWLLLAGWISITSVHAEPATPVSKRARKSKSFTQLVPKAISNESTVDRIAALSGKIVGTLEVRGQKRIEKEAVLAKLVTKAGHQAGNE